MSPLDVALRHQELRAALARRTSVKALALWRLVDPQELDAGWDRIAPQVVSVVSAGQVTAARQATPYLAAVDRYYGMDVPAQIIPEAFGGVMLDGREVGPAMFSAVTTTKQLTGRIGATRAFEAGAALFSTLVTAAIQDMGRQADNTLAAARTYTSYVRVVNPGGCSRCAILAGKESGAVAFKRHPRCKCTAWPLTLNGKTPEGFHDSPGSHFDSLTRAEQDRIYTKAGAEAIRQGADPISVVNARRGAYGIGYSGHYNTPVSGSRLQKLTIGIRADGTPLEVYATTEGTTARGAFGRRELRLTADYTKTDRYRRTTTVRLMPEQLAVMAGGDPVRWRELLVKYGYIA